MGRVSTLAMYKLEIIVNFMVYYVLHNETLILGIYRQIKPNLDQWHELVSKILFIFIVTSHVFLVR